MLGPSMPEDFWGDLATPRGRIAGVFIFAIPQVVGAASGSVAGVPGAGLLDFVAAVCLLSLSPLPSLFLTARR